MRDVGELQFHNSHVLWGQTELFKGMQLRLPAPACVPDHSVRAKALICQTVLDGDTVQSIAKKFETSAEHISSLNSKLMGPLNYLNVGMRIRVPHPNPIPDPRAPCVPDAYGLWSCYTVGGSVPVVQGDDLWGIAIRNNADLWRTCELNNIDCANVTRSDCHTACPDSCSKYGGCPVLISPGTTLIVASTACTPVPGEYTCYHMQYDPTSPPDDQYPVVDTQWWYRPIPPRYSRTQNATVGMDVYSDPLGFFDAYYNLNKPFISDKIANKSDMVNTQWFPNMHVKIPIKSPCVGADPNACVTIDETRAQKMAEVSSCKAHQYQNCTWSDNMVWMALWWMGGNDGTSLFWVPGSK
jgi:hypothetical protein